MDFSGTPHLVYNCDETGFGNKGFSRKRVLCHKKQKTVYTQQVTTREHTTVHCCTNAAGEAIPPFIIFAKCLPSTAYSLEGPTDALYGVSDTGYMDSHLFLKWLEHFVKYAPQERPLLLFMRLMLGRGWSTSVGQTRSRWRACQRTPPMCSSHWMCACMAL